MRARERERAQSRCTTAFSNNFTHFAAKHTTFQTEFQSNWVEQAPKMKKKKELLWVVPSGVRIIGCIRWQIVYILLFSLFFIFFIMPFFCFTFSLNFSAFWCNNSMSGKNCSATKIQIYATDCSIDLTPVLCVCVCVRVHYYCFSLRFDSMRANRKNAAFGENSISVHIPIATFSLCMHILGLAMLQ